MKREIWIPIVMAAFVVSLTVAPVSAATSTDRIDRLADEIATLRAENARVKQQLVQMQAEDGESWLNERRAEEVKALIADVLSDAETRASLLDGGMTAGHNGKNFFLASADGTFLLKISGQIQFRYIWNNRDEENVTTDGDENESGFALRRTKLLFAGHIGSPKINYAIQLAVDRDNNSVSADKIVISWQVMDGFTLWVGEDKAPFLREELTSSSKQLAVERSSINEVFTVDKVQGIGFKWDIHDQVKIAAVLSDGAHSGDGSADSNYEYFGLRDGTGKDFDHDQSEFSFTARADVKLDGDWKQMNDFTAWHGEPTGIFVGAAIHHQHGEVGDTVTGTLASGGIGDTSNSEITLWTVDASLEMEGWNFYIAYIGASTDFDEESTASGDTDPWGLVVQGGYQIPDVGPGILEPFIRYEMIDLDDNVAIVGQEDDLSILTLGANYYFKKHAAKLTFDVVIALDELGNMPSPGTSGGLGLLSESAAATNDNDGQTALRIQYQLLF